MVSPPIPLKKEWITHDRAWNFFTQETGVDSLESIKEALEEAYAADLIQTRRIRSPGNGSSEEVTVLASQYWTNKDLILADQNDGAVIIEVKYSDLMKWLRPDGPAKARDYNKRGPKDKYDWERFWIEVALIANTPNGLPEKQADFERMVADWDWFVSKTGDSPSESAIRGKAGRLYRSIASN